ncbi:MAG: hypothetical protein IPH71_05780 [Proteobacteria bacterium]|nr:hypothetical protein [Pseudomonadota bacterium]
MTSAIYSHTINTMLYLPDYPIRHAIAFRVRRRWRKPATSARSSNACRIGSLAPDLWMIWATGKAVGPEALIEATARALREF